MSGNSKGGHLAAKRNIERHGADFYAKIGAKGGRAKVAKGFAVNRDLARSAGALGGTRSRRGKSKKTLVQQDFDLAA
jgi:general stress protein YciG